MQIFLITIITFEKGKTLNSVWGKKTLLYRTYFSFKMDSLKKKGKGGEQKVLNYSWDTFDNWSVGEVSEEYFFGREKEKNNRL